jgi:hypothetical protein
MKINRYDCAFVNIEGNSSEYDAMNAWVDRAAKIVDGLVAHTMCEGEKDGKICFILTINNKKRYTKADIISALSKTKKS